MNQAPVSLKPEPPEPKIKETVQEIADPGPEPITDVPGAKPLDVYEQENDQPFLLEYLGIERPHFAIDEGPERENIELVDQYVKEEIKATGKKENTDSYGKILSSFEKRLGIEANTKEAEIIERMGGFLRAFQRIKDQLEKENRKETLKTLFKLAKGKDLDDYQLEIYLVEKFLQEREFWNDDNTE